MGEKGDLPSHSLLPMVGDRAGPGIMRVGELALSLTHCSTRESRPYTSLGQHARADSVVGSAGETAPEGLRADLCSPCFLQQ